jgi:phytoene dehydrogenase-like protein
MVIAPTMEYVERAFNHSKYGEYSAQPVAEIIIPTVRDPGLAPAGKHVLSAVVQYAPRNLKQGWPEGKAAFTEVVMGLLARYAPAIREQTLAAELLTPEDIEREFRPKAAQYRMPVEGLFLCGAGTHPGGGVMGSAGRNAARAVLAN